MSGAPRAQAQSISYDLHTLGWKGFQDLCSTLLAEIWGQTVETFFDTFDGGRDAAFYGVWKPDASMVYAGSFSAQCKFTAQPHKSISALDLDTERSKAARLAEQGLADNYFLLTNYSLTGAAEEALRESFLSIPRIKCFAAYGLERISQIIRESPKLRRLVPRIYGLGDLGQILDERAYAQAQELLSSLGDDLSKFVVTDAYRSSQVALANHGFVLLLGEPACGKSTIAATLALGARDDWGCSILKIRSSEEFRRHWNPHEPRQLFWVDDCFGATQYDPASVFAWNQDLATITSATRLGTRFIFTSRDYIYQNATYDLKQSSFPLLHTSQVVIHVEDLSRAEREQILYNHLRKGTQPTAFKSEIKEFLPAVAANPRFSPEVARRLGDPVFTKHLTLTVSEIDRFVENPADFLLGVIRAIGQSNFLALAMIFMRGGELQSPVDLDETEARAVQLLGGSPSELRSGLRALNRSMVLLRTQSGTSAWVFKHPTLRDAVASIIADEPEMLEIYLAGAPLDLLLQEVVCGDVKYAGAKVAVPHSRYDALLRRLDSGSRDDAKHRGSLIDFLAARCDKSFLSAYIALHPDFVSRLRFGSYIVAYAEVNLLVRLKEYGILPEETRKAAVARFATLAIDTPDMGFLAKRPRQLLIPQELISILERIRDELLPNLNQTICDWKSNHDGIADPEEYFRDLKDSLADLSREYEQLGDKHSTGVIADAYTEIDNVVEQLNDELPENTNDSTYQQDLPPSTNLTSRSIFEDVDG